MFGALSPSETPSVDILYTSSGIKSERALPAVSASIEAKFQSYFVPIAMKRSSAVASAAKPSNPQAAAAPATSPSLAAPCSTQ